mmetsp:Transcript_41182/g.85980  ORF Transcript_41182/g.85980 Transcript_41182/m.85980 type:complete len:140 (+) Transcript_41182:1169-1588(+)
MGMTLVNGYLAHAFLTSKKLTLREYTNIVSLAMCAKVDGGGRDEVAGGTRASRVRAEVSAMQLLDPGDMPHQIFIARKLRLGGKGGEGRCKLCDNYHASGFCKTCSKGLGTDHPKLFWIFIPGKHGRQCYCRHLHDSRV